MLRCHKGHSRLPVPGNGFRRLTEGSGRRKYIHAKIYNIYANIYIHAKSWEMHQSSSWASCSQMCKCVCLDNAPTSGVCSYCSASRLKRFRKVMCHNLQGFSYLWQAGLCCFFVHRVRVHSNITLIYLQPWEKITEGCWPKFKVLAIICSIFTWNGSGWGGVNSVLSALAVLHCALVARKVLIRAQCFGCCWAVLAQHQGSPQQSGAGQDLGRTDSQESWLQRYSPGHDICPAGEAKRKEEGHFFLQYLSSGSTAKCTQTLLPRKWPEISCWWKVENTSFVLLCFPTQPLILLNCLYLDPHIFSHHLFSQPSCWGGKQLGGHLSSTQPRSTHHTLQRKGSDVCLFVFKSEMLRAAHTRTLVHFKKLQIHKASISTFPRFQL